MATIHELSQKTGTGRHADRLAARMVGALRPAGSDEELTDQMASYTGFAIPSLVRHRRPGAIQAC